MFINFRYWMWIWKIANYNPEKVDIINKGFENFISYIQYDIFE